MHAVGADEPGYAQTTILNALKEMFLVVRVRVRSLSCTWCTLDRHLVRGTTRRCLRAREAASVLFPPTRPLCLSLALSFGNEYPPRTLLLCRVCLRRHSRTTSPTTLSSLDLPPTCHETAVACVYLFCQCRKTFGTAFYIPDAERMCAADLASAKVRESYQLSLVRKSVREDPRAIPDRSPRLRFGLEESCHLTENTWPSENPR